MLLVQLYPEAAGMRETRHGCLPLHLAAFASSTQSSSHPNGRSMAQTSPQQRNVNSKVMPVSTLSTDKGEGGGAANTSVSSLLDKPTVITHRSNSEATAGSIHTTMSAAIAEEKLTGKQSDLIVAGGYHHIQPIRQLIMRVPKS